MTEHNSRPARFIAFEGIDGCGKTTVLSLFSQWLGSMGVRHIVSREPGATPIGEALRAVLLNPASAEMQPWAEVLLYMASRIQHIAEVIRPALHQGTWVLADRYADATLAYQGYGRGLDLDRLRSLHAWTTEDFWPDCTVLLDCGLATAAERRSSRNGAPDRLEQQEAAFHERVRTGYLQLAASNPERFIVLNAARPLDAILKDLCTAIESRFGPLSPSP